MPTEPDLQVVAGIHSQPKPNQLGEREMKSLRVAAVLLVTAAAFATATAPRTEDAIKKGTVLSEGTSPAGSCPPNRICR
jgi:hypothetical protein